MAFKEKMKIGDSAKVEVVRKSPEEIERRKRERAEKEKEQTKSE